MQKVRKLELPFTSQMRLFLQLCPSGRVIGITGASGKSTTTSLVGAMAEAAGLDYVVGGNLGIGGNLGPALLEHLPEIRPETTVILEISHTQLQYTDRSPGVAAIMNITPNHLDQFTWDEYVGLKQHLIEYQGPDDIAVFNQDDQTSRAVSSSAMGQIWLTSLEEPVDGSGGWIEEGHVVIREGGAQRRVADLAMSRLRGRHNLANTVMACTIAAAAGIPDEAMRSAIASFPGVAHRLEIVGQLRGVTWINDSIATTPERTAAGLDSFAEPIVLLLGGRDKHLPLDVLQRQIKKRCRAVVCFGEAGDLFHEAVVRTGVPCTRVEDLKGATAIAADLAAEGDVVLLSPAATSFDAYPNFEARGRAFGELFTKLSGGGEDK